MVTTTSAPAPVVTVPVAEPSTPPPIKPGYATTEGWLSFAIGAIALLPTTLFANTSSTTLQIVGLIVAGVTAIAHGTNRTALKRAHLEASKQA